MIRLPTTSLFFFFNDTATTEIYTLSLHDALPIFFRVGQHGIGFGDLFEFFLSLRLVGIAVGVILQRSEEHTSELQSRLHLVCRLLLEKKKRICSRRLPYMTSESSRALLTATRGSR